MCSFIQILTITVFIRVDTRIALYKERDVCKLFQLWADVGAKNKHRRLLFHEELHQFGVHALYVTSIVEDQHISTQTIYCRKRNIRVAAQLTKAIR